MKVYTSSAARRSDTGRVSDSDGAMQSEMDRALLRVVTEALEHLPVAAATVSQQWVEGAGMWFVKVRPRLAAAARFDIGYDRADLLNVTVGNIWFEVPVTAVSDLEYAKELAAAVFAGRVEESGRTSGAHGRILLEGGPVSVGAVHLPWPWRPRPSVRRYAAYS
jgi:hypothetical protein